MFDQLSAEILASLIKGFPRRTTTTTTKQNVDPAVHFVYSRVKMVSSLLEKLLLSIIPAKLRLSASRNVLAVMFAES
jgi:ppGpp synthetase/RelA/SpoT-type nucleotidyltranferase